MEMNSGMGGLKVAAGECGMEEREAAGRTAWSADGCSTLARALTHSLITSLATHTPCDVVSPPANTDTSLAPSTSRTRHTALGHGTSFPFSSSCGAG